MFFNTIKSVFSSELWSRKNCLLPLPTAAVICLTLLLHSCTTNITVDLPDPKEQIVVEGYIENGDVARVLLTRNSPFFGGFDLNDIEKYLVNDAVVTVTDGVVTDTLRKVCITVTDTSSGREYTICRYVGNSSVLIGELNKTYQLRVEAEGKEITASTAIPDLLELDSLWYEPHENPDVDSLVQLIAKVVDPDTIGNYVRVFTKRNDESFYPVFAFDDRFINGQSFRFPIQRGEDQDADYDPDTYGYFWKGDTATVKWAAINKASYDFWNTLDYETNSGGPFGSATVIKTNINGGLGIWQGAAVFYKGLRIPQ